MVRIAKNFQLHGNVSSTHKTALIIIDVFNDLSFSEGKQLLKHALPVAKKIARLKAKLKLKSIPCIYVNDNFGIWRSNQITLLHHCLEPHIQGQPIAKILEPDDSDYFVMKAKNSGFFSTPLETLLNYLGSVNLVLTGLTTENCVFFTAADAYMRDLNIYIPSDCVASAVLKEKRDALRRMAVLLKAEIFTSIQLLRKKSLF